MCSLQDNAIIVFISIILSLATEFVKAANSHEGSLSPGFDWGKLIDWAWSYDTEKDGVENQPLSTMHEPTPHLAPPNSSPHKTQVHTQQQDSGPEKIKKRKKLSNKERYSAERLKEINHANYVKIKNDPIKWKARENARKARYHDEQKKLALLTGSELEEQLNKQRAVKDRKNYLARLRRNPNARIEPKRGFVLSEKERANCRERTRLCRLRKKLSALGSPSQS
ncbi:uncharacterized protein FA14DRAFT_179620 [Meira miltonrushii]|uniref:Uncharacterized protein n=1 Tax=Meira miltonrushii TaxID=1280837 RepID=A0A316VFE8_9BASI|nr:uncharacterized protein FA14DRAFT_179620 [Meira miltonrushii]PWN36260.1 hypothetical protein FA14DRAFT_179620 [Meira miltonrushii]